MMKDKEFGLFPQEEIDKYFEEIEAAEWADEMAQMKAQEEKWEDNGCA